MTRYFEVTHRDGAARLGRLLLDAKEILTPAILETKSFKQDLIFDLGSLWLPKLEEVPEKKLVILPHKTVPLHTPKEIIEEYQAQIESSQQSARKEKGALGFVVHPALPKLPKSDLYILGCAKQLENNPRALVNAIINIRENSPPDTALYAPALATPENLAILIYLGVDIVDDSLAIIKAYQDLYQTSYGEIPIGRMNELPCTCAACINLGMGSLREMDKRERAEFLSRHNAYKLEEELRIIRERIRGGTIREHVEEKCRTRPWLTAALRLVDFEYDYLERRTPVARANLLYANSAESLNRIEIKRYAERIMTRYTPPSLSILVLLPCSARKPYSTSPSHKKILHALGKLRGYIHEVIITSPLGVVPRELELTYPAAHYDIPVTGHWDLEEKAWVENCLKTFLKRGRYKSIIAHLDGPYKEICEALDLDILYTAEGGVTSVESLERLKTSIQKIVDEETKKRGERAARIDLIRAIADYQFGFGAGGLLAPEGAVLRSPYPKHQVFLDKQLLASLVPQYGLLALTPEGAEKLLPLKKYWVKIDNFIPKGAVLAPGVIDAYSEIRPGDEVIVIGEKVLAVGRASMSGWEMVESTRGVAVEVRHVRQT